MGSIILQIGQYIYDIYYWLMLISILGSWFPQFYATKVGIWISKLVDPYFAVFRRFIPPLGVIDFSPIIALIAYRYLGGFALEGLRQLMNMMGV
ncbi:YggT family protein [Fictibacillus sp. KIGAM418]|uniref:YggT family protein n=1 Tax=Fictibacillus marinisediminis TaxID=2878389 RepID=A0A9X1XAZ8_9BACL|nr:YggT family protein [Fictibacillus marinisediminis]MCK6257344.1 YggT family protein [Fictibacillus marinisediminis]